MFPAWTNIRCNQSLKRISVVWLSHSSEGFYELCIKLKPWSVFLVLSKISGTLKPVILYLTLNKCTTAFCLLCSNCVPNPTFEKRQLTCTVEWHPLGHSFFQGSASHITPVITDTLLPQVTSSCNSHALLGRNPRQWLCKILEIDKDNFYLKQTDQLS